jgi:PAS domain-containing protein
MAERRLWDSINTIRDGFAVFDGDLHLLTANRAWTRAFGDFEVKPGVSPYADLLQALVDGDLVHTGGASGADWVARMLARLDADPIQSETLRFNNGIWVRLVDRRSRDGDLVSLAIDITEQMRIWAAIEALPDGFVLFDREERLLACNQRYRDMFPDSAAAAVPGTTFEDLLRYGLSERPCPRGQGA